MVNKVILIGYVGNDPDIKLFNERGSECIANVSLATTKKGYTSKDGREVKERTEWHKLVMHNALAKVVEKYVKKGDKLYIEGELRTRNYDDAQGVKHYITEIHVSTMQMLGSKPKASDNDNYTDNIDDANSYINGDIPF